MNPCVLFLCFVNLVLSRIIWWGFCLMEKTEIFIDSLYEVRRSNLSDLMMRWFNSQRKGDHFPQCRAPETCCQVLGWSSSKCCKGHPEGFCRQSLDTVQNQLTLLHGARVCRLSHLWGEEQLSSLIQVFHRHPCSAGTVQECHPCPYKDPHGEDLLFKTQQ